MSIKFIILMCMISDITTDLLISIALNMQEEHSNERTTHEFVRHNFICNKGISINEPTPESQSQAHGATDYQGKGKAPMLDPTIKAKKQKSVGMGIHYNEFTGQLSWNVSRC